ncbi:uncharacterized protein N7511_004250 [Penicillium nucicola]|uniref:uncharacterized protein n=1 Tax=Penicillium nucicola TaxID=1850975 RepID=UPI0025452467|nr:uncharacterized protein N7511_004250 [Penicillium nucicola]KAJ5766634.1 hypothetical protein N7511_004250 [Penicillium nucicola]
MSDSDNLLGDHPDSAQKYQCSVCLKQYKRREHLFRHFSSHTSQRPYQCTSCDGAFQRADVLKRHLRTCDSGVSRSNPRRRACDRCVRQKKACSSHQPCLSCAKRGVACWYPNNTGTPAQSSTPVQRKASNAESIPSHELDHAQPLNMTTPWGLAQEDLPLFGASPVDTLFDTAQPQRPSPTWQDLLDLSPEAQSLSESSVLNAGNRSSLHFLDKFTSNTGLVMSFDCGTHEQRELVAASIDRELMSHVPQATAPGLSLPLDLGSVIPSSSILEDTLEKCLRDDFPLTWLNDPLSLKTHEILLLIEEVVTIKPRNSSVTLDWSPALKKACLQFFSPPNIRRYLCFYWAIWHPNVNFVHRPTFDPLAAKPTVLAAMALIGACVSPDMPDNEDARTWLNCVEEMVFIDDDFNNELSYSPSGSMTNQKRKIQALQAAYIVCLYQNWEGTDSSKSRIRRYRFATLVSTARDIGIATARHQNYSEQGRPEFEWREFAAREELIRVFTWIFLLDTSFVIFNNLPPRMVIKEMRMHMAMPETCFQATTADQCHQQIQFALPAQSLYWKFSFRGAFESLCKNDLVLEVRHMVSSLGPLVLFALASAIHSQIFQFRSAVGSFQLHAPISNALSNWRDIWQTFSSMSCRGVLPFITIDDSHIQPENLWRRMGFYRYSPEFWLLANLMADRLAVLGTSQPDSELELLDEGPIDPILNHYDQTSMRQVNDLIMGFQTFQI